MLVSGVVLGTLAGFAIGRSWRPLLALEFRWFPLLLAALVARGIANFLAPAALALYLFSLAGTAVMASANARLPGAALVALGGALNLATVLANGAMPVDPGALSVAGAAMPTDALHTALVDTTQLKSFSDVVPIALLHAVYSVGDFLIALGGFLLPFVLLIRK